MSIETSITGAVATVTINRPEKMNALTREMREGLIAAFEKIRFEDRKSTRLNSSHRH